MPCWFISARFVPRPITLLSRFDHDTALLIFQIAAPRNGVTFQTARNLGKRRIPGEKNNTRDFASSSNLVMGKR
jgi:hypothetical protein